MKAPFHTCKVTQVIPLNESVRRYLIAYPPQLALHFIPGQFIMVEFPCGEKPCQRAYSIASVPDGSNCLELLVVLKEDGLATPYLFTHVKPNDELKCTLPMGKYSMPEQPFEEITFVCTGTGVAPFRSMIQWMIRQSWDKYPDTHLIFGCRTQKDLLYSEEWKALEANNPWFRYTPVLSRADANWDGAKGYVHAIYMDEIRRGRKGYFYLCGWSAMIKDARNNLSAAGIEKQYIKFETYD